MLPRRREMIATGPNINLIISSLARGPQKNKLSRSRGFPWFPPRKRGGTNHSLFPKDSGNDKRPRAPQRSRIWFFAERVVLLGLVLSPHVGRGGQGRISSTGNEVHVMRNAYLRIGGLVLLAGGFFLAPAQAQEAKPAGHRLVIWNGPKQTHRFLLPGPVRRSMDRPGAGTNDSRARGLRQPLFPGTGRPALPGLGLQFLRTDAAHGGQRSSNPQRPEVFQAVPPESSNSPQPFSVIVSGQPEWPEGRATVRRNPAWPIFLLASVPANHIEDRAAAPKTVAIPFRSWPGDQLERKGA